MPGTFFCMNRYNKLSFYWKNLFQTRIQKIPLDAGFDCPNRDGLISRNGCIFCTLQGSGTGLGICGMGLREQYHYWRVRLREKYKSCAFAAYLQSYSNTYGPLSKLKATLNQLLDLPDLRVFCAGTRPDCIDKDKARLLAGFPADEIWLELGLQSANDKTLSLINRGHSAEDFDRACDMAEKRGLRICAHVIAGLPGEDINDFADTVLFLNRLPVHGIKIHNLYVCAGTTLAQWWQNGLYTPLTLEEYAAWTARAITLIRPDIIIHRTASDPAGAELLAPAWAEKKNMVINTIDRILENNNQHQGQNFTKLTQHGTPRL